MLKKFKLKDVLEVGLALAFIGAVFFYKSPVPQDDDGYAKYFRDHFECHLILTDKEDASGIAILSGIDLKSKKDTSVSDTSKWILVNFDKFNIGDTILKDRGHYNVIVKSKNKAILFHYPGIKKYILISLL